MKKKYFLIFIALIASIFVFQNSFWEINQDLIFEDDGLKGPVLNDPLTDNLSLINELATILGFIFIIPGVIGLYLCPSIWVSWLSKKSITKISPVLSWIPILRIYPLMKSLGISGWWALTLYIPMIPVAISQLSQKMWIWVGGILSVIFLPHFTLAYIGLKENKKSTWIAWVFGFSAALIIVIFFLWILSNFALELSSSEIIQD